jgi:hypothetical protein
MAWRGSGLPILVPALEATGLPADERLCFVSYDSLQSRINHATRS